jgi:Carboxypeptidase regulatory-like domain
MKNIKKQDVPAIGMMLKEAFSRNKIDFVNFSSMFDDPFETELIAAIQAVKDRRRPVDVFGKQQKVTVDLYNKVEEMREALRLLSEYVIMVEDDLKTLYKNYYIKEARRELQRKNVEGIIENCEIIVDKVITDDAVVLNNAGFDSAKLAEFEALIRSLELLNTEQSTKMDERQEVKAIEDVLFAAMFDYTDKVARVGKAMYTYKEKQRYDDFSVSNLLGRMNHGRKKQIAEDGSETETAAVYDVMIGRVTNKINDEVLEDVVVRIEGANIMADTDEDGEFYIDEIPAGVYTISFAKKGFVKAEQHNVEIGTSSMVELLIELVEDKSSEVVS